MSGGTFHHVAAHIYVTVLALMAKTVAMFIYSFSGGFGNITKTCLFKYTENFTTQK